MVKLVLFYCLFVLLPLRNAKSVRKNRIVGGIPVEPGQFPFLVSVQMFEEHLCGGSIISRKIILTAAHCLKDKLAESFSVVAGTYDLKDGGVRISASQIKYHQGFNFESGDFDLGLVFLSSTLTYSATIQPVELPSEFEDYHSSTDIVTVVGWGIISKQSGIMNIARYARIPLWSRQTCLSYQPHLTMNKICAGSFDGQRHTCSGDSGGPFLIGRKVIAIVSYGQGCGTPDAPSVGASVSNLRPWISMNAEIMA